MTGWSLRPSIIICETLLGHRGPKYRACCADERIFWWASYDFKVFPRLRACCFRIWDIPMWVKQWARNCVWETATCCFKSPKSAQHLQVDTIHQAERTCTFDSVAPNSKSVWFGQVYKVRGRDFAGCWVLWMKYTVMEIKKLSRNIATWCERPPFRQQERLVVRKELSPSLTPLYQKEHLDDGGWRHRNQK